MPCRKTLVLCSLCLAGACCALVLGLLTGFAPTDEGPEIRRRASALLVSPGPEDVPEPIVQRGDGVRVWAVRQPARHTVTLPMPLAPGAAPGADPGDARDTGLARALAQADATIDAALAVQIVLALHRPGEVVSFADGSVRLSMDATPPATRPAPHAGTRADAQAGAAARENGNIGITPLMALDGATAPQLVALQPEAYGDTLDMEGRPLRWQGAATLMAAIQPFRPAARGSDAGSPGVAAGSSGGGMSQYAALRPAGPSAAGTGADGGAVSGTAGAAGVTPARGQRYHALVESFARRYNLSIELVYAIIHSESDFSPTLVSSKSATGLMQLLPSTASDEVHRFLYGRRGQVGFDELTVPEVNIRYGTAYLHILMNRYFGAVADQEAREYCTIAAYNMGPNRFLRLYGGTNEEAVARINGMSVEELYEDLTARLPVRETRAYVAKVRRMKQRYAALLGAGA